MFDKTGFGCPELADYLRGISPGEVEIAGVATNICVIANAVLVRTVLPDARVFVDRRCVASYDPDAGEKALDVMRSLCVDIV